MIKIPIKVEKAVKSESKFVEWKIHNVCNHNCSFCGLENKDGSQRWYSLEAYKEYTDKIIDSCDGQPFWIQITGGEPTLFPELIELIKYIKQKGGYTSLISNGTRTLRWWNELKESQSLDQLYITYHSEQTDDYQHVVDVLNIFHSEPTETLCLITHVINTVDLAFEASDYIKNHTGSIVVVKAMMLASDIYSEYSDEQLNKLKQLNGITSDLRKTKVKYNVPESHSSTNNNILITYSDNSTEIKNPQTLLKQRENNFFGWQCDAGRNFIRVDGNVPYRGVCGINGPQTELKFTDDFVTCDKTKCFCVTDLISTKTK